MSSSSSPSPLSPLVVKEESRLKGEPQWGELVEFVDSPEEELIATNPGIMEDEQRPLAANTSAAMPQTQEEYFRLLGYRVEEEKKGAWLTKQYELKQQKLGLGATSPLLPPTEEEILLQERLPINTLNFREPLKNWIPCDDKKSVIPGWNKEYLPEEPLERPPSPVRMDHSITTVLALERKKGILVDKEDERDVKIIFKEGAVFRVSQRALDKQREQGRPSQYGRGRQGGSRGGGGYGRNDSSFGQGRSRPRSRSPPRRRIRRSPPRRSRSPSRRSTQRRRSPGDSSTSSSRPNSRRSSVSSRGGKLSAESSPEGYRRQSSSSSRPGKRSRDSSSRERSRVRREDSSSKRRREDSRHSNRRERYREDSHHSVKREREESPHDRHHSSGRKDYSRR